MRVAFAVSILVLAIVSSFFCGHLIGLTSLPMFLKLVVSFAQGWFQGTLALRLAHMVLK